MAVLVAGLALTACRRGGSQEPLDKPTEGRITIASDESFRPLVQAEVDVFEGIYHRAHFDVRWKPENEAIQDLLADSVRLVVVSRELTEAEAGIFKQLKITPRSIKIAEDGVALILNRSNPDSMLTMSTLRDIFGGRKKTWADVRPGAMARDIAIVFDNNNSSNLNYVLRKFDVTELEGLNIFAADSNAQVIEYVRTHENALGVIGTAWISDSDDENQQRFLSSITVMSISAVDNPGADDFYQPYQAYLSLDQYPLERDVLIISREARAGLGSGFMSHVASHRGQLIVLKSGLLPVTMPVRLVGVRDNFPGE